MKSFHRTSTYPVEWVICMNTDDCISLILYIYFGGLWWEESSLKSATLNCSLCACICVQGFDFVRTWGGNRFMSICALPHVFSRFLVWSSSGMSYDIGKYCT